MLQKIKNKKPIISIIIPIYNVEQYLAKCLNSVLQQTYSDFECILVDDGSTDTSGSICDKFAAFDSRITVVHKKNGGLVSARKAGLQKASGEFIGYIDPDDWIEKNYFELMINMQQKSEADIVAGNHFRDIGLQSYAVFNKIPFGLYDNDSIQPQLIYSGKFFEFGLHPSLCTKLIRKKILENTQMSVDEKIFCEEDGAVIYPSVLDASKILITDICGYHYVQRQGSITKTKGADDLMRLKLVFSYLEEAFAQRGMLGNLNFQLTQWKKFIFLERQIQLFDKNALKRTILMPFGGIPVHSRIVIYGANTLGQNLYQYINNYDIAKCVLWIDKAYEHFQRQKLPVTMPEDIHKLNNEYDFVLLATVTESIVFSMKEYLSRLQIPQYKILWLTDKFIESDDVILKG